MQRRFYAEQSGAISEWRNHGWGWQYCRTFTIEPPTIGARFLHRRVLGADNKPAEYVVTAVRNGVVYYKQPDERKSKECCDLSDWQRVCGEVLCHA